MTNKKPRSPSVHGNVSPDAHDAWHATADSMSTNVSAILEALGRRAAQALEGNQDPAVAMFGDEAEDVKAEARAVQVRRRRRRRTLSDQ